jgi:hypothetical protein
MIIVVGWIYLTQVTVEGFCEGCDKTSVPVNDGEYFDWLNEY